jgi:hypothetical protein
MNLLAGGGAFLQEALMGLGFVELIVAVEDAFGFAIPDEDAAGIENVGRFYEWILAHRLCEKRDACLYSMTFYKVRRAMMSVLHVARDAIRPSTDLASLVSKHYRRTWRDLQAASGFRLPELRRPLWLVRAAACLAVAFGIATPVALHVQLGHGASAVAIVATIVYGYLFVWLTKPLAFDIQPEFATVALFVRAVMARNYWAITKEAERHAEDAEAWKILQNIVGKHLGLSPELVTKETRLQRD